MIDYTNNIDFSNNVRAIIYKKLVECIGEENLKTDVKQSEQKSYAYTFVYQVMKNIGSYIILEQDFCGYMIDDINGNSKIEERKRLYDDIENTDDIIKFLILKLYFK